MNHKPKRMKNYKKFVSDRRPGPKSPLSDLEIDEAWFFEGSYYPNLYQRLHRYEKKTGKKFEYLEIKNGVVVRRYE